MPKEKDIYKAKEIQAAAMKLVIKTGFVSLKMAEVAKSAGMATGTVYIYYKSKDALINDVYIETKREIIDILTDKKHIADTFYLTFKNVWMSYFNFCLHNPEKMLFVDQFLYSGYITDEVYLKIEEMFSPLNFLLVQAQQNGLIKQVEVDVLKAQMEGSIHEVIKMMLKRNLHTSTDLINSCFDMAWDSIKL